MAGCFITLEGVEGVGKTTNLAFIRDFLQARLAAAGIDVVTTREPGGTPLAEEIRSLLLAPRDEAVDELTELLLVFAARAQHLAVTIKPYLAAGRWVLCDRFTDATFAYQGAGRGLDESIIASLAALVHADLTPDLTLCLDLPWTLAQQRLDGRELDRLERESATFFERVRDGYRRRALDEPDRFVIVSAEPALETVQAEIARVLDDFLRRKGIEA